MYGFLPGFSTLIQARPPFIRTRYVSEKAFFLFSKIPEDYYHSFLL